MQKFIGDLLENVTSFLNEKGIKYEIYDNNFSVDGDTKLVTNIIEENGLVKITTGNFLFDVKNKK